MIIKKFKIFESFDNQLGFERMSHSDWVEFKSLLTISEFTQDESDYMESRFSDSSIREVEYYRLNQKTDGTLIGTPRKIDKDKEMPQIIRVFYHFMRKEEAITFIIFKMTDDWFMVAINSNRYYRCDEFEGLCNLIDYIMQQ